MYTDISTVHKLMSPNTIIASFCPYLLVLRGRFCRVRKIGNLGSTSASSGQAKITFNLKTWYLYLLFCDQKTFYIGITDNPAERLLEHRNKKSFFTKKFSDIQFVYCEKWPGKQKAALREKQIKGWSRAKKQMLIDGKLGYNVCTELVGALGRRNLS